MATVSIKDLARFTPPNEVYQILRRGFSYAAGVYRLRDVADSLVYVGFGANPATRIKAHSKQAPWWSAVDLTRSNVEWFRTYADASIAEKLAIRLERPAHNMIYSYTRPHWSHERGGNPRKSPFVDGQVVPKLAVRGHIPELITAVRTARSCLYVEDRYRPAVAVVPVELADLARRVGGADLACRILLDHVQSHGC